MIRLTKVSEPVLNLLYYLLNRTLFSNKLPRVRVKLANLSKQDFRGAFMHTESGKPLVIIIDKGDRDPVRVLIHEMTHVYIVCVRKITDGEDHPPSFVRKLRSCYKKLGLSPPTKTEIS